MRAVSQSWTDYLNRQHQSPHGYVGRLIGERMVRQHAPETQWSIDLLNIQPTDRVLEIGFGAGRGLALAAERAYQGHITGVDLSPTMLQAASRRNRAALLRGQLSLLRGTVADLPFTEHVVDRVFSIHTFYFWPDPHAVCKRLTSLLAQGGRMVSTLATAQRQSDGAWHYWDVHQLVTAVVDACAHDPALSASLQYGPNSREYNNVAIVIDKN